MAFRNGDRNQKQLFPPSIEEYIEPDAPVRAYDAFVEALDLEELGIDTDSDRIGNPRYNPKAMLKLLIYGYSYGVRSSRRLERETHYNLSFIWLTGGLKPDHKTIAEFRRNNRNALKSVLKQCARLCIKLDLIEGNTLFIDGTKIRANASLKNNWTKGRCRASLAKIDERIDEILSDCESVDQMEKGNPSLVSLKEEFKDKEKLRSRVQSILEELDSEDIEKINTTDPDCAMMRGSQGSHASYNVQSVVDEKHGLIISSDAVKENNDSHQFANQVDKANEVLGKKCENACADSGYSTVDELEKIDEQDIRVVVPSHRQAIKNKKDDPFDKSKFRYDSGKDCYICPEGHELRYSYTNKVKKQKVYRGRSVCGRCRHFGICTKNGAHGRGISRLLKIDLQEKLEAQYEDAESQRIFALRKQKVELPFGHIKRNLSVDGFLLRRLDGVKAEVSLLMSCFNIARMITILGVRNLVRILQSSPALNSG